MIVPAELATAHLAMLRLTPFPHGTSAKRNKKAVQCTADFVIRATICEQAPIVPLTTKATLSSGFLVALCARDSGGMAGFCARRTHRALFECHSALTDAVFYTKFWPYKSL